MGKVYEHNYLGMPVHVGLSAASMTLCEQMHLTANGCDPDNYDPDCEECPYNVTALIALTIAKVRRVTAEGGTL